MQARQHRVDGFARRGLTGADEARQVGRVELPEFHRCSPSLFFDFHPEEEHVAVEIGHIEVAQAVVVVRRRLEHLGAALHQVGMQGIDVVDVDATAPCPGWRGVCAAEIRCSVTSPLHRPA